MSSPITGNNFEVATNNQSFCARITNLLAISSKLKIWFDWAFTPEGNASTDLSAMFLPPPNVILPYWSLSSFEDTRKKVELLNGGTSENPFWRLCDGTLGTPDLRGRFLLGAGQGTSLSNRTGGESGGAEKFALTASNLPAHGHEIESHMLLPPGVFNNFDGDQNLGFQVGNVNGPHPIKTHTTNKESTDYIYAKPTGDATSTDVPTVPPFYVVYYIIRTSRTE